MIGWRGFAGGVLALVAVQKLVSSKQGPGAVKGIGGAASRVVARFLDPHAPLWSDAMLAKAAAAKTGTAGSGSSSAAGLGALGGVAGGAILGGGLGPLTGVAGNAVSGGAALGPLGGAAGTAITNLFGR